ICTLGPASATRKLVQGLANAGASVFRLNFSHGTPDDHARRVGLVRRAEEAHRFKPGQEFRLRAGGPGDDRGAATPHPGLAGDLDPGDRVFLADGAVELNVTSIEGDDVVTECVRGGVARS